MKSTQVTTWRRYTAAEKKAYHERVSRRMNGSWVTRQAQLDHIAKILGVPLEPWQRRILIITGMGN